jgi:hypothetical protein
VEAEAVDELLTLLGRSKLDPKRFVVTHAIRPTDPKAFVERENAPRRI